MKKLNKQKQRNPIVVAMMKRYGNTTTVHDDRRERRPKDARHRDWSNEES